MFEKWKFRKYKEIFLVDSENVGYTLPNSIDSSTLVYMFVSDTHILSKLKHQKSPHVKVIDLTQIVKRHTKNAMDFCIVAHMSEVIKYINRKQKLVILSKDKGYDAAIDFLKDSYPDFIIERSIYPLLLINGDDYYKKIYNRMSEQLKQKIVLYDSMSCLKKNLSQRQKKVFYVKQYKNSISGLQVIVEYDIYNHYFLLYHGGRIVKEYELLEEALKDYEILKEKVEMKYKKYYSKEMYTKAKELKIHKYIEEAYSNHQTLQECLIQHFGQSQGTQLFQAYVH